MNMLLHGIAHADIRQEDTIRNPQHLDQNNELMRFDRVMANPPFSQNYSKKDLNFSGRFAVLMPEKGKKADLMFVQHILAVLKRDGRLATVMPHGVLFRGGEEAEARKYFIDHGYLEAVIGLPAPERARAGFRPHTREGIQPLEPSVYAAIIHQVPKIPDAVWQIELIDLKPGKVKHQDIGQMNMYLNYFNEKENARLDIKAGETRLFYSNLFTVRTTYPRHAE